MQSEESVREYKRIKKQEERELESYLIKFKAWERFPGESYADFKRRFKSVKIVIQINALPEEEKQKILSMIQNNW